MKRELNHLVGGLGFGFFLLALLSFYWSIIRHDDLLTRPDNPRRVQAERTLARGIIVDRHGIVIAANTRTADDTAWRRIYPYSGTVSAVGYFNYQYGVTGLEASFDSLLKGNYGEHTQDAWQDLERDLLHEQIQGYDLRATLDLNIQQAIVRDMAGLQGAVIVTNVSTGQILALVSQPDFNPNTLDLTWESLTATEIPAAGYSTTVSPLINRTLQAAYQPGSAIYPLFLSYLINNGDLLNRTTPNRIDAVDIPDLPPIGCLVEPKQPEIMTLRDAFASACPQAFLEALTPTLSPEAYQLLLEQVGFLSEPAVYQLQTAKGTSPAFGRFNEFTPSHEMIGQGQLTLTPLQMMRFVMAIANNGSLVPLSIADAYRLPNTSTWLPLDVPKRQRALLSPDSAFQLQRAMAFTSETSPLLIPAQRADFAIRGYALYGYVGHAFAGEGKQVSWFLGFIIHPNADDFAVVVVLENPPMIERSAYIGGNALQLTLQAFDTP